MIWTSAVLTGLLLLTAILFPFLFHKDGHIGLIILYALIQFFFSYGPNTLIFVIIAEIFPTKYRCFCYGWAAASGKIGAMLVQVEYIYFDNQHLTEPNSEALGWFLYQCAGCMAIVGIFSWLYVPKVNRSNVALVRAETCIPAYHVPNKPLEFLGEGRGNESTEDKIGFMERMNALVTRLGHRFRRK